MLSTETTRVCVFTPSHQTRYLADCHASLRAQTHSNFEWVVVLNGSASSWRPSVRDERVRVLRAPGRISGVGALKRFACEHAQADLLVELDHDDLLTPGALAEIVSAFDAHPDAALVFSDFAQMNADGTPNGDRFDPGAGWVYSEEDVAGRSYLRCHALAASPHNLGYIWYAPNHVRAFRRTAYDKVGGYEATLKVLDDQDLMIRLYEAGEFVHIDRLLYLQRVHPKNTQSAPKTNAHIQTETVALYDRSIRRLAAAWAERNGLAQLRAHVAGSPAADNGPGEQTVAIDPVQPVLPYLDDTVGLIKLTDVLPRVKDTAALFNECHRVLRHGGLVLSQTPSTDGRGAFQDPTYVSFWNENSFWYLTQAPMRAAHSGLAARFQVSRLHTGFPTEWHAQHHIPYVYANLIAIKEGPRQGGPLLC